MEALLHVIQAYGRCTDCARTRAIPGSIPVGDLEALQLDLDEEVVVYCDCPNDASAALVAARLRDQGFSRVRPLAAGIHAWRTSGFPLES